MNRTDLPALPPTFTQCLLRASRQLMEPLSVANMPNSVLLLSIVATILAQWFKLTKADVAAFKRWSKIW
jgi:hypothetical protein